MDFDGKMDLEERTKRWIIKVTNRPNFYAYYQITFLRQNVGPEHVTSTTARGVSGRSNPLP